MLNNLFKDTSWLWTIPAAILLTIIYGINGWSALGISASAYFVFKVIQNMGRSIPIIDLMTALAALQWIVGPFIDYHNEVTHYKYHMYVPEAEYMSYIVPAIIAFRLGTRFFNTDSDLNEIGSRVNDLLTNHPRLPYILIAVGLLAPFFSGFTPAALNFVFFLLANVKYIGVIYLLFSKSSKRWPTFLTIMTITALASIASGMFHDLLLWAMLSFTFVARELNLKLSTKLFFAIVGMFVAITIQSVKHEYRNLAGSGGYSGNKTTLFLSLVAQQWSTGGIVTPASDEDINVRLNQGWIISAVMDHVPESEPFAGGTTITEGITASILPRILAPGKKRAGGRENFERFTGQKLAENTSMGISLAGEGYANYGRVGGIFFMFCWGIFISWFWLKLQSWSRYYPTLLIWSPIIFLQVVKAETEFVVVLNHMIKASVLVMGLLWFVKRTWNIRI
jgi:hypothetical protein